MNKDMSEQEYINFLNTINTLPKKEYEIIRRGVLQLNDDKKALFKEIDRLNNIINRLEDFLEKNYKNTQDIWYIKIINKLKELKGEIIDD